MTTSCLVTGGNGFVGSSIIERLRRNGRHSIRAAVRIPKMAFSDEITVFPGCDLYDAANWHLALRGISCVIHTAARVHISDRNQAKSLEHFRKINVEGTLKLAKLALDSGIERFVFLSSIGVNGGRTFEKPFQESDTPNPQTAYAVAKWETELALHSLFKGTNADLIIIRPPLVYGEGAPGNFSRLIRLVAKGIPIPLGSASNVRSFIGIDNLTDFVAACVEHPAAANETFLISDADDISIVDLLREIGAAVQEPVQLLRVPIRVLSALGSLVGQEHAISQLTSSLRVDSSKARCVLGWNPPLSLSEGLFRATAMYR